MSLWESHWNIACFRTMHMLNTDPIGKVVENPYEGFFPVAHV